MGSAEKVLFDIQKVLGKYSGYYPLRISYWGNDTLDSLTSNYDFYDFSDSFLSHKDSSRSPSNIFLIVGSINFIQLQKLKEVYDNVLEKKYVVHIQGGLANQKIEKSYMSYLKLDDFFSVDLVISSFPLNVPRLLEELVQLTGQTYE